MESLALLRILRSELLRRGLPRDYVERVTGELADHADDMAAEAGRTTLTTSTSALRPKRVEQLGDPVRLADGFSLAFQQRTFLGRHPWWTFVGLPAGAMSAAWLAANLIIVLLVELLLGMGGVMPSDAWRWVAALATGMLAYGMTYGMPVLLCWWALRKVQQTTRACSWAWATTTVLVLTSFLFRISLFRMHDGRFGIDSSVPLRCAFTVLFSNESLPTDWKFWSWMMAGSFPFAYLAQIAVLVGATSFAVRQFRRSLANLATTEPTEEVTA